MKKLIEIVALLMIIISNGYAINQDASTKRGDMNKHEKINYVEFPAKDIGAGKVFYRCIGLVIC